jgi:molybdenum storage protein
MVQLLPAMLAAARGAVFNGIPPYDLWEHPPEIGRIPPHRTDSGAYLVAEVFGARRMIFVKDVDGLYTCDPVVNGENAEFISRISVSALLARDLPTLPLDPIVLDLMQNAKLVKEVQIINGLLPGTLTRALAGEPVGSTIYLSECWFA